MKFARDFKGVLVDAKVNNQHGNFICPQCHNLAHWRKESVDQRRPHFYHAEGNEDCPLSVIGGKWKLLEDENVEYWSELGNQQFVFPKNVKPNLSKIPLKIIKEQDIQKHVSPADMEIQLSSTDVAQIEFTVSLLCNVIKKQRGYSFCAIPLPVKVISPRGMISSSRRIYRRLVRINESTPELVEELSAINIPAAVNIEFKTYLDHEIANYSRRR